MVIDLLGQAVEVDLPGPLRPALREALTDLPTARGPGRRVALEEAPDGTLVLVDEGRSVLDAVAPAVGVATLVWRLNAIVAAADHHVVLHAGGVDDGGGALCLPGRSGSGKSWLTADLVRAGGGYLSDEHVAIDLATGLVAPVPKPLDLGPQGLVAASSLGPGRVATPCGPAAIVFPRFEAGADLALDPLDPTDLLLALCDHATNLVDLGPSAFLCLAGLARTRPAARLRYGSGAEAVAALRAWRNGHGPTPAGPVVPEVALAPVTPESVTVEVADGLVVFDIASGSVHRLNHSAGLVWLCAAGAGSRAGLVRRVGDEAPPGAIAAAAVTATVDRFVELGLLDPAFGVAPPPRP